MERRRGASGGGTLNSCRPGYSTRNGPTAYFKNISRENSGSASWRRRQRFIFLMKAQRCTAAGCDAGALSGASSSGDTGAPTRRRDRATSCHRVKLEKRDGHRFDLFLNSYYWCFGGVSFLLVWSPLRTTQIPLPPLFVPFSQKIYWYSSFLRPSPWSSTGGPEWEAVQTVAQTAQCGARPPHKIIVAHMWPAAAAVVAKLFEEETARLQKKTTSNGTCLSATASCSCCCGGGVGALELPETCHYLYVHIHHHQTTQSTR